MNPGADRLPTDVLQKIFSYLPCEDLVKSVQFVCTLWQQASWERSLWKHIMYKPDAGNKIIIQMLKQSPQLRIMYLTSASVDSNLIQFITDSCPSLEHLHISWDSIYNNSDVTITRPLSQIKILSLFRHADSSLDFPYLDSAFPNLESLHIAQLRFSRKDLEPYLQKKQNFLHTLSISCCAADDLCVLPCLSVCTKLRNLSLYKLCGNVSWKEVGHLPNISHLTLHYSDVNHVNDSSAVFCSFPNVTALTLHRCTSPLENEVCIIARNCPQLQKLKFSYFCECKTFKSFQQEMLLGDTLQHAIHFERLTHLYIYRNGFVSDKHIENLWLMPQLIHLDLYECERVTPGSLKSICGFSELEVLKFDLRFKQLLPADLRASDVKNKNLQLMFYNCQDVSSLESLRLQHLRVCLTGYSNCKISCSYPCLKEYYTCWMERYDCYRVGGELTTFPRNLPVLFLHNDDVYDYNYNNNDDDDDDYDYHDYNCNDDDDDYDYHYYNCNDDDDDYDYHYYNYNDDADDYDYHDYNYNDDHDDYDYHDYN